MTLDLAQAAKIAGAVIGFLSTAAGGVAWLTTMHAQLQGVAQDVDQIAPALERIDGRLDRLEAELAAESARRESTP